MFQTTLMRLSVAALLLGMLGACNPYVLGAGAFAAGPNLATGRNGFYHLNKVFGKRCSDSTFFDRPQHCVNDAG
ncbi:MAG: hypothetical protein P1U88_20780 [Thalassobaculaceae bacterium]|nr:hypothetical protein [Thalassobaculaceae bacterium]